MSLRSIYAGVLASYYGKEKDRRERGMLLYRYVYRPLSFPITAILLRFGFSANQVTLLNLLLISIAVALLCTGGRSVIIAGVACYFAFFVFDFVDGNIARYTSSASYFGKLLDGLVDSVGFLVFAGVAIGNVRAGGNLLPWQLEVALGVFTAVAALFRQNYSFRLAYLKLEAGIIGAKAPSDIASPDKQVRTHIWLYDNLAVSAPVLLPIAAVLGLLSAFTVLFAVLHGVVGLAGILISLVRNRNLLDVERSY